MYGNFVCDLSIVVLLKVISDCTEMEQEEFNEKKLLQYIVLPHNPKYDRSHAS
jgi:hypothetical protein